MLKWGSIPYNLSPFSYYGGPEYHKLSFSGLRIVRILKVFSKNRVEGVKSIINKKNSPTENWAANIEEVESKLKKFYAEEVSL